VRSYEDLPTIVCDQIAHFFRHYKDLEQGKWVKVTRWAGPDEAAKMIEAAIERAM
jgi:inorganic pyrophosphatase